MPSKVVQVYVVDAEGNGLSGQRVKLYGEDEQRTDSDGCVRVLFSGSEATLFVNGYQAFSGYVSRLGSKAVFSKAGQWL
jgi:hypothetical protein